MKKILSFIVLISILFGLIDFNMVFASFNITDFSISGVDASEYSFDIGKTLGMNVGSKNDLGDNISDVYINIDFGNNSDFSYTYMGPVGELTKIDGTNVGVCQNSDFTSSGLRCKITNDTTTSIEVDKTFGAYTISSPGFKVLSTAKNYQNKLTVWFEGKNSAGETVVGDKLYKNIYLNVKPHITDYSFSSSSIKTGGKDEKTLTVKVMDSNGCSNIDSAVVKADLSQITGYTSSEDLSFVTCDSTTKIATFQKNIISNDKVGKNYTFTKDNFSATDEDGNQSDNTDSRFKYSKITDINLSVVEDTTPVVTISSTGKDVFGGPNLLTDTISFSANKTGSYKVSVGNYPNCESGAILDWQDYSSTGTIQSITLSGTGLIQGENTVYVCVKNTQTNEIGSTYVAKKYDTISPNIDKISITPYSIAQDEISNVAFACGENGSYSLDYNGVVIGSGTTLESAVKTVTVSGSILALGNNNLNISCTDNSTNKSTQTKVINITKAAPSMGDITSFQDNDVYYNGLDGRDISFKWNTTQEIIDYSDFESYRVFLFPATQTGSLTISNHIGIFPNKNQTGATLTSTLTKDSLGNDLVNGGNYKLCMAVISIAGKFGPMSCSQPNTLKLDVISNANIKSAKIISNSKLEITTDIPVADKASIYHKPNNISFKIGNVTYTGNSVISTNNNKIVVGFTPALTSGNTSAVGTDFTVGDAIWGAVGDGGYNANLTDNSISVTDGQLPVFSNFNIYQTNYASGFYNGNLEIAYNLSENLIVDGSTKLDFVYEGGNPGTTISYPITLDNKIVAGNNGFDLNLESLGLVSGAYYTLKIYGKDAAGNIGTATNTYTIKYDKKAPSVPVINTVGNSTTGNINFNWGASIDDNGNGVGVKNYNLQIFKSSDCSTTAYIDDSNITTNSKNVVLTDIGTYSWKVRSTDKIGNTSNFSNCLSFKFDNTIANISNFILTNLTTGNSSYIKSGDNIKITTNVANAAVIKTNLSGITGNDAHSALGCVNVDGITCTNNSGELTYTLTAGNISGAKSTSLYVETVTGMSTDSKTISFTADSANPVIGSFTSPVLDEIYGGKTMNIVLSNAITDANFSNAKLEYSSNGGTNYIVITNALGPVSNYEWSLTGITTGTNYKLKITAFDKAGNQSVLESPKFAIDTTGPVIATGINIGVDKQIYKTQDNVIISWDLTKITGTLTSTPISFAYIADGTNYVNISGNYANSGTFTWNIPSGIDSSNVKIMLIVTDKFGNIKSSLINSGFVVDATLPTILFGNAVPPTSTYINSIFEINGSVFDAYLQKVTYKLQDLTLNKFLNVGTWQDGDFENNYCTDNGPLASGHNCDTLSKLDINTTINTSSSYRLTYKGYDKAGNIKTITRDYIGDIVAPVLQVNNGDNSYFKESLIISGTSSDNLSGVSGVKVSIKKGTKYWNGTDFVDQEQILATQTTNNYSSWNYTFNPPSNIDDNQVFDVIVYAYDKAYKTSNTTTKSFTAKYDKVGPVISSGFITNPVGGELIAGGVNTSLNITWDTQKVNDVSSGLKTNGITLSYYNGTTWNIIATGLPNAGNYLWQNIPVLDTTTRIKFTIEDNIGNESNVNSNIFTVDSTPPEITGVKTKGDGLGQINGFIVNFSEIIDNVESLNIKNIFGVDSGIVLSNSYTQTTQNGKTVLEINFASSYGNTSSTPVLSWNSGVVVDLAGKTLSSGSMTSQDNAGPRVISSNMYDNDSNGKFDMITLNFSENIASTNNNAFTINNALDQMSIKGVSISGNIANISLNESSNFDTSIGKMSLNFDTNSSWNDFIGNNASSKSNILLQDVAGPILYKASYFDTNGNNKIDKVVGYFTENVEGFAQSDFAISGLNKTSATSSGNVVSLNVLESTSNYQTVADSNLIYIKGSLKDSFGNYSPSKNSNVSDEVSPIIVKREAYDTNYNGKIDLLKLELSEDMGVDFTSFDFVVDGYNILGYNKYCGNANNICVVLQERPLVDTSITPQTRIATNSTVKDISGNILRVETALKDETVDKMGGIILSARYEEGNTVSDDLVTIIFSEKLNLTNVSKDHFTLYNAGVFGPNAQVIQKLENSITLKMGTGSTRLVPGITKIAIKAGSLNDLLGNASPNDLSNSKITLSSSIIVNEIMYSSYDSLKNQYIELKNLSSNPIDISGYKLAGVLGTGNGNLPLTGTIPGNGYYLIAKSNNTIISGVAVDLQANLSLGAYGQSQKVQLIDENGSVVDNISSAPWPAGNNTLIKSMERKDVPGDGTVSSNWYTAGASIGFINTTPKGTPRSKNIYDAVAPEITSFTPGDSALLPTGNFGINLKYQDNTGGLGVQSTTAGIKLYKYNSSTRSSNIASTYITVGTIDANGSSYNVNNLPYGKYKIEYTIGDFAGNTTIKNIEFYVDNFSFNVSQGSVDLGALDYIGNNVSSDELVVTVKTIGVPFNIDLSKNDLSSNGGDSIIDYNGTTGYGYELYNDGYLGVLNPIGNGVGIASVSKNINTLGELNTYTYKLKFGAKIGNMQSAGIYNVDNNFGVNVNY